MIPDVEACENAAVSLLLSQSIRGLTTNVKTLTHGRDIRIATFRQYAQCTDQARESVAIGKSYVIRECGPDIILYDGTMTEWQMNWSIAHEIGHTYLDHPEDSPVYEKEADIFASFLLLPSCVLRALCKKMPGIRAIQIARLFNHGLGCARMRMQALHIKNSSDPGKDAALLKRYAPFIEEYCQGK